LKNHVWLIGAGGHAKVVAAACQASAWTVEGIFDRNPETWGRRLLGIEIKGDVPQDTWWADPDFWGFLSIGANAARKRLAATLRSARWAIVVHPSASVHPSATLGPGALVCAHAVIQPDAQVGAHAIVNTGAVVEHDNRIGDFCHIGPNACLAGNIMVEEGAFLGAGSTVIPGIRIGAWSTIGAGAAVIEDIPEGVTAVGVPARPVVGPGS
jgi:sugar O-acyltransferase (sialic acid O-acetyltransferase NeuD family)